MTDRMWEATANPDVVLTHVQPLITERSSRLVAAGFIHTVEYLLRTTRARTFLQKLDEYADGTLTRNQLEQVQYALGRTPAEAPHDDGRVGRVLWASGFPQPSTLRQLEPSLVNLHWVNREVALATAADRVGYHPPDVHPDSPWHTDFQDAWYAALATNADVVRCAVPTPLRTVPFDAVWRTSTAVAVAAQARKTGDFSACPILADALQDAGCCDDELLAHLRSRQGHHGCCWGVRVVLDKPALARRVFVGAGAPATCCTGTSLALRPTSPTGTPTCQRST